jgi:hypothetical protein
VFENTKASSGTTVAPYSLRHSAAERPDLRRARVAHSYGGGSALVKVVSKITA